MDKLSPTPQKILILLTEMEACGVSEATRKASEQYNTTNRYLFLNSANLIWIHKTLGSRRNK